MINKIMKLDSNTLNYIFTIFITFFVKAFSALSIFFLNLIVARSLSAEDSGFFFLGFTIVNLLGALTTLGLQQVVVRFFGIYHTEHDYDKISSAFWNVIAFIAFFSSGIGFIIHTLSYEISIYIFQKEIFFEVLKRFSLAIPAFAFCLIISQSFYGVKKPVIGIIFNGTLPHLLFIGSVIFINFKRDNISLIELVNIYLICVNLTAFIAVYVWFRYYGFNFRAISAYERRKFINASLPLFVVMLMELLIAWSAQLITGVYETSESIAVLSVTQRTAMLTSFILLTVNIVVSPRIASLYKNNKLDEMKKLSLLTSRIMVSVAIPVCCVMIFFPSEILSLFGDKYVEGSNLLRILTVGQFFNVITGSVGVLLIMTGFEKDFRNVLIVSGCFSLLLSSILIPFFGVLGASVAIAFSVASQNIFAVLMVKKRLGFNTLNFFSN